MEPTRKVWNNGELVDWEDATVHVGVHALHYGSGVFEGIRCYETPDGPAVFRLADHVERLERSARVIGMELPYSASELQQACLDVVVANELAESYLRPICFYGYGELGVAAQGNPVDCVILSFPWGALLGQEALEKGIRVQISSWQRVGSTVIPHAAKTTGVYLNSMLALREAHRAGFDEAILLTSDGFVADGSGENVFVVRDETLFTPSLVCSILPGITRATVLELARELGYRAEERKLIRSELYLADEVFFTGTAAEVLPIRSVDDVEIGVGPITLEIQRAYFELVRGSRRRGHASWLELARPAAAAGAGVAADDGGRDGYSG